MAGGGSARSSARRCDVAVVGGGIAGVSIAAELAGDVGVVLVEMERELAAHSTGRSAAAYIESYGPPGFRRLTTASRDALAPVLAPRPMMFVARAGQDAEADAVQRAAAATGARVVRIDGAEVEARCAALRPGRFVTGVLDLGAADIDVHALHQHDVRRLRSAGGVIIAANEALRLERLGDGWLVHAARESVHARIVVNAAGAWGDDIAARAGLAGVGLEPRARTAFTVRPPGHFDVSGWPLVVDVDETWYFRPEGPQVMCSLADARPTHAHDVRPREIDVALAIDRINEATTLAIRSVTATWAGLRTFAPDGEAVIGPHVDEPSFVWFVGQGGYGIQSAPAAARYGASVVLGHVPPPELASVHEIVTPTRFLREAGT